MKNKKSNFLNGDVFIFSVENNIFTIDYLSTIASIPKSDEIEEEDMDTLSISGTKRRKLDHITTSVSEE